MNECPYCQNTFEMTETCADEFRMWQGLQGPYYIPAVDSIGNLSWTNTGELPNPDPVNIAGKGLTIVGIVMRIWSARLTTTRHTSGTGQPGLISG